MRWLVLLALLSVSVFASTIADFPYLFVENGNFSAIYVIGGESPSLDVVSATVISTSLAKFNVTTVVGSSRLDSEVADVTVENAIVIGSPCDNKAAFVLEGRPSPCYKNLGGSSGYIKLFEQNGRRQLLITGLTAADRHAAAKYLASQPLTNLRVPLYIVPTGTNSQPPFFERNSSASVSVPMNVSAIENETVTIVGANVSAPAQITNNVVREIGDYEPLRDFPKSNKSWWDRLISWLVGIFT